MKVDDSGRMIPPFCPMVEALLAHERTIVPQVSLVRARALARARNALRAGDVMALATSSVPRRGWRLLFAATAGIALLDSAAAAYQLLRSPAPSARSPHLLQCAQVAPSSAATETAPAPAAKSAPVRAVPPASTIPAQTPGTSRPTNPAAKEDIVFEELRLLERAQQSVTRGDYAAVLAVTTEHERRYSGGRLCEEREALRLRALIGLGRSHEARQAAARFRHDFPRSVLLLKLDDMLASSP
jgi:hypothetical protein